MKKVLMLLSCFLTLTFGLTSPMFAQDAAPADSTTTDSAAVAPAATTAAPAAAEEAPVEEAPETFHQVMKTKFIEGDWVWMSPVLACMILGLAICLERIISLNLATTNTKKLVARLEKAINEGGVDSALTVTKSTTGPVASIFTQGLMRMSEGVEMVEKSIIAYGSVEMSRLEKGLPWIALFIALAPMLGFLGTVVGMIQAFDAIEAAGDISPTLVAAGIKVALLTTVAGLIVAIILQIFYNYLIAKVDSLVSQMEEASISLVDILVKYKLSSK